MARLWYCLCLLFLVNSIKILMEESYQVVYWIVSENKSIKYLDCANLSQIYPNKTRINLDRIKNDLNYSLSLSLENDEFKWIKSLLNKRKERLLNKIESKNYLIYRNRICLISNDFSDSKLFFHLFQLIKIDLIHLIFDNETFTFLKLLNLIPLFNQISIQHKEYPYSKCSKDYSNFKCLNDKIKRIQPLSKYYYDSNNMNESIELNYKINQTIIDNESKISKQCNKIDCKISFLNGVLMNEKPYSMKLKSFLYITNLDFYLQLIGLIILILNNSIYQLLIKFTYSIKLSKFFKLKYLKLDYLILFFTFVSLSILFNRSIYDFKRDRDYPLLKSISVDSAKSELSIVICVELEIIKGNDYNIYNKSLFDIEKDTDNGINIALKDIYLELLNKKISTKWELKSKFVAFRYGERCFLIKIFINQSKYLSIFATTKLIVEFNEYSHVYILNDNEIFNHYTYKYDLWHCFRKIILERSKLNQIKKCKEFNLKDDNCESKWNCIDKCISRKVYNQFKNLVESEEFLIYKQHFEDKEWSNLFIRPYSEFDAIILKKIKKECDDKYLKLDQCIDIEYERQSRINKKTDYFRIELDLNYEIIYHKEEEPSIFKLILDLLNIQANLFGLNFFKFLFMILTLLKLNLKLMKIFKLLIYLICLIGFIFHLWSIYDEILNIEIIFSEYFELINFIEMPDLIFCFNINQTKINSNFKLTYEYLDKITEDLKEDKIFNQIEYLNQSNKWIKLDNKTKFNDNNFEIKKFYFLERKCFKLIYIAKYFKDQFNFVNKNVVLKISFNRIYLDDKILYFFTKTKNKFQFSKIDQLILNDPPEFRSFRIIHEIVKRDEFELIKNPLSFGDYQNVLDKYFNKLIDHFEKKLNLVTFNLPIEKKNSNLKKEINDNLFIQLYNQENQQDQANCLGHYSKNHLKIYKNSDLLKDFEFDLSFYRKVIVVSNKISLIKLIINLLNLMSFWFDLGILDLHNYFLIFKLLPLKLYKLLIIIKNKFYCFLK